MRAVFRRRSINCERVTRLPVGDTTNYKSCTNIQIKGEESWICIFVRGFIGNLQCVEN